MSGMFTTTAGMGPTSYANTLPADKGMTSQVSAKEQINRFYGRTEHEPKLSAYQNRAIIDQTLGDQYGDPKYTLDVGMTLKNLIRMDAETPWYTIIMPLQNTNKLVITGTTWKYNKRLPTPTPYHAPSPYISEETEKFYGKIKRYGEQLRMESDFFHTPEGQENFFLKLTGMAGDFVEGIRYDVMREMQAVIMDKKRYYFNQAYVEDPLKHIAIRVSMTGAMNKVPNNEEYNALGVILERLSRVLNDATGGGPYEMIVPMEWGIYMHKINMTPAPQPYYMYGDAGGQVFIQNGPTPKGTIGTNRFWEYDDIHVETGSKPLRMLERALSVCEYYIAEFTARDVDLFRKLTSMMGGAVDIKRSRNIWTYSATHDRYQEISVEDMIKNSHVVPSKHTKQAYRELKNKYARLKGSDGLLTKFYPNGGLGKDDSPNVMKHREAPHFLYYENKYSTFHRTKYSGEADLNVTEAKDHRNQGQILCSILASKFNLDRIGSHYSNAFAIRMELQMARDSREYWAAFLEDNILESIRNATVGGNDLAADALGTGTPRVPSTTAYNVFAGSLLSQQSDFKEFSERWGRRRTDAFPVLSTQPGGGYVIPAFQTEWRTDGLTAPPGCDCAVGILSIASMPTDNGWGKYYEAIRDHKNALLNMVECAQLIPDGEATNPLNRSPFVTDPDTGALDAFYTSCVSQFRAPLFLGGYNLRNAQTGAEIQILYPRVGTRTAPNTYDAVTLSLGDDTAAATSGLGPNHFDALEEAEYATYNQAVDGDPSRLPSDFEYVQEVGPAPTALGAMDPYGLANNMYTNSGLGAAKRMPRGTQFFLKDVDDPADNEAILREYIAQGITALPNGTVLDPTGGNAADQVTALVDAGLVVRWKNTDPVAPFAYFPTGLVFTRGMEQSRTYAEAGPICLPGDPAKHYYEPIPTISAAVGTDAAPVPHNTAVTLLKNLGVTDIKGNRKAAGDWKTGTSKHFGHFTWNQMHGRGMGLNKRGNLPNKREIIRNLQNMDRVDKYNDMKQRIRQARSEAVSESRRSHEYGDEEMDEDVYYSEDGEGSGSGNIRSYEYGSGEEEDPYAGEEMEEEGRGAPKTSVRRSSRRRRGGITALASAGTDDEPEEEVGEQILGRDTGSGSGGLLSSRRTRRRRRRSRRSRGTSGSSDFDAYAMAGAPLDPRSATYYAGTGGAYTRGDRGRRAPFATHTAHSSTAASGQGGRHMFGAGTDRTYQRTVTKATKGLAGTPSNVTSMREGYKMIYRFNGSNFVSKMTDLTTMPNDVCTAFTIAAMMGRQDEQEHWETMVTNGLHLPINFLLQRIIELYAESAILCKAGLGLTVVNNGDFKNAETVSTKTYHGHLTIHYGALVVQKDWLLMMEDARIVGYIGGKGDKFLTNRKQLLNGATHGKGNFRPSFICYAYPIACQSFYPILSLSGRWEFEDVRPENLPTDGALFPGVDWYELLWGWNAAIYRDRVGQRHWRKQGYIWPRTSHAGWYMAYDMNGASFSVKERGKGHLAGSDYSGALAALQGEVPFWKYPGDPAVF